jgi:peroxiredoxin Q/BCP
MIVEGQRAPDFTLEADDGVKVSLGQFRGKRVVLYFYPEDDTPGCTREACDLRDSSAEIRGLGAEILGVSADSVPSHRKFKAKHRLPFRLLADVDRKVIRQYGVWGEKQMFGRKYMGIVRSTFLIDEKGRVAKVWFKTRVPGHRDAILAALRGG